MSRMEDLYKDFMVKDDKVELIDRLNKNKVDLIDHMNKRFYQLVGLLLLSVLFMVLLLI